MVNDRFLMSPTPIPKFDNPKMDDFPALQLFGAGREKRIYAVPPYTKVKSLDFDDHPFAVQQWEEDCALCGAEETFLDEVILRSEEHTSELQSLMRTSSAVVCLKTKKL